jgi:hypothetical protein
MGREIGILMSQPMIVAGFDRVKVQTRRSQGFEEINKNPDDWDCGAVLEGQIRFYNKKTNHGINIKSRYHVGDHLYWKETHYKYGKWIQYKNLVKKSGYEWGFKPCHDFGVWYENNKPNGIIVHNIDYRGLGWYKRPSMFMFKKDARIWSTVLKVEAQQLKDITEEDAMAEGMSEKVATYLGFSLVNHHPDDGTYYRHIYKLLWGHLNGEWQSNLWVWKYSMTKPEIRQ